MGLFAVVDSGVVVNVIVADSKEVAEEVTQRQCFDCTDDPTISIGFLWSEEFNTYISPQPQGMASWVYNPVAHLWEPPIPYPSDDPDKLYTWVEPFHNWVEVPRNLWPENTPTE